MVGSYKEQLLKTTFPLTDIYKDSGWKEIQGNCIIPIGIRLDHEPEYEGDKKMLFGPLAYSHNIIIGGVKGSGKTNFIRCLLSNLLLTTKGKDLNIHIIDTRENNYSRYSNLKDKFVNVVSSPSDAKSIFSYFLDELDDRWNRIKKTYQESYKIWPDHNFELKNKNKSQNNFEELRYFSDLPRLLLIVEDWSELMKFDPVFFKNAALKISKSVGLTDIHIILSSSELSEDIYPAELVQSFGSSFAFKTNSEQESHILIGCSGAEELKVSGEVLHRRISLESYKEDGFIRKATHTEQIYHVKTFNINEVETTQIINVINAS